MTTSCGNSKKQIKLEKQIVQAQEKTKVSSFGKDKSWGDIKNIKSQKRDIKIKKNMKKIFCSKSRTNNKSKLQKTFTY